VRRGEQVLIIGDTDAVRSAYEAELVRGGLVVATSAQLPEEPSCGLILVAGPLPGARRDGLGAVIDAVSRARARAPWAAVYACVPREGFEDAVRACFTSGADDVLLMPLPEGRMVSRVLGGLHLGEARSALETLERYSEALGAVLECDPRSLDTAETLHDLLGRLCEAIGWSRAALILEASTLETLHLVAASDELWASNLRLPLHKYPEVAACLRSSELVHIPDSAQSPLLGQWAALVAERAGPSLLVAPVASGALRGALLFRSDRAFEALPFGCQEFLRQVGYALGFVLKESGIVDTLKEQTRRTSLDRYVEKRRQGAIQQSRSFFESSSDGVVVVDADAQVLYVNRVVQELTGYNKEALVGTDFTSLLTDPQRQPVREIVRQLSQGVALEPFDLWLSTTSGETLTVSASGSSALVEHGCAVLHVRDVTERRLLEAELRKTKDFLERLIDSTVDAIIACDLRGHILLFNQGATQLFGYSSEEAVGRLHATALYPEGGAQLIMAALRAPEGGGPGRLQASMREVVTKSGEVVPVSLAAAIVYENGVEVATVGVLSDLRERLQIEARLAAAQEQLVLSEKQVLLAELAGTTAHELNQPLTSIMGYAELLKRRMDPDDGNARAIDIIFSEATRMAEIVRKVGRITRYETKTYVGSTQILDLERASSAPEEGA
jgi:PAS domain S-box-containing protein